MLKKTIKILMYSQRIVGRSIMNQAFRSLQYIDVFSVDSHAPTVGWVCSQGRNLFLLCLKVAQLAQQNFPIGPIVLG